MKSGLNLASLVFSAIVFAGTGALAGVQTPAQPSSAKSNAAASVDGTIISSTQLESEVKTRLIALKSQEYKIEREALDDKIEDLLLEKEASRRGITVNELLLQEIDAKVRPATPDQVRAVYESTRDKYGDKPEADALKQIEQNLRTARLDLRRKDFVEDLRAKSDVRIFLNPPRVNVGSQDTRTRGPQDAPVTIVEFGEFQCPFCGRSAGTLKQLEAKYNGQIRIVFKDFPLAFHQYAPKAAEAASCADEQGKFWEMHDKLFKNQSSLAVADLKRYAAEISLDSAQFNQCLDSDKYAKRWQTDRDEGSRYGITGTPTFFINGQMLVGSVPVEAFSRVIDDELQRKAPPKAAAIGQPLTGAQPRPESK